LFYPMKGNNLSSLYIHYNSKSLVSVLVYKKEEINYFVKHGYIKLGHRHYSIPKDFYLK